MPLTLKFLGGVGTVTGSKLRWSYLAGQIGGEVEVYSGAGTCRQVTREYSQRYAASVAAE